jgi:membrane-associated protease RseP (regulator of RpoE activity)
MSNTNLREHGQSTVTITFDQAVTNFDNADLTIENGTLTNVTSSNGGKTWTATFTPTANIFDTTNVITLNLAAVTDLVATPGVGTASSVNYKVDTIVDVTTTKRWVAPSGGGEATGPSDVGAIGIIAAQFGPTRYNPVAAVPATFAFTGDLGVEIGKSLAKIPSKVGALVHAISGGERDPETPISVVGASIIGGDTVDHGLWVAFWFFLAQLNFVLGAINLVPLLPFDGGHIAVAVYEKLRNVVRKARGLVPGGPVDYGKLMPATYVILVLVMGYMALTVTADLVNPIRLFQ